VNCELLRNSQSELTAIWGLGSGRKRNGRREQKVTKIQSLVRMQPLEWKKKRSVQSYKSLARDLDLEHTLDVRWPGDHRVQVWSQSSNLPARRSDFRASTKVPVSRDLRPWPWSSAQAGCRLTCASSILCILCIVCKFGRNRAISLVVEAICEKKFTDRQTDRQTDKRRTPRDCRPISSWNELKWIRNFGCPLVQKIGGPKKTNYPRDFGQL